jgi:hypothetical protein
MIHLRGLGPAKWLIAACVPVLYTSDALALKYVIPYPKDKRDAMTFVVIEKKDGTFEFRVILDEQKLGQQVPGFLVTAYPKPDKGRAARGVEFSAALMRDKAGKLHATFVLDRELAFLARGELAVAPFPGDGKEVPGGTFLAFRFSDFVDYGPDGVRPEDLEKFTGPGRFQDPKDAKSSPKDLPQKVRPIPEKD